MKTLAATVVMVYSFAATAVGVETELANSMGITAESAVIAGLSTAEASEVLAKLDSVSELRATLQTHQIALNLATQAVSQLASVAADSQEDPQSHLAEYLAAISELNAAKANVTSATNALFNAITDELSAQQILRLNAWKETTARRVPPSFRVVVRTTEQWDAIEQALKAEARASRLDSPLENEHEQILTAVRAELDVIVAQASLESALVSMNAVFNPN
jgi:hypothetical protein